MSSNIMPKIINNIRSSSVKARPHIHQDILNEEPSLGIWQQNWPQQCHRVLIDVEERLGRVFGAVQYHFGNKKKIFNTSWEWTHPQLLMARIWAEAGWDMVWLLLWCHLLHILHIPFKTRLEVAYLWVLGCRWWRKRRRIWRWRRGHTPLTHSTTSVWNQLAAREKLKTNSCYKYPMTDKANSDYEWLTLICQI